MTSQEREDKIHRHLLRMRSRGTPVTLRSINVLMRDVRMLRKGKAKPTMLKLVRAGTK